MRSGNTPKNGEPPEVLEIKLTGEPTELNERSTYLMSDASCWLLQYREIYAIQLDNPFEDTVASLKISAAGLNDMSCF